MAKLKELKTVAITLNYRSSKDLIEAFKMLKDKLSSGFEKDKGTVKGNDYDFKVINTNKEYEPLRIETINGNKCEIFASKINEI